VAGYPDFELIQVEHQLRTLTLKAERARDEVRTYLLALTMGPAVHDRSILRRTAHLRGELSGLAPGVAGLETHVRQLSKRAHRGRHTPSSAFGRIGQLKGHTIPQARMALERLEAELRTLEQEIWGRFLDPLRTATPFSGTVFDLLNFVIELLGLVLKVRQEEGVRRP
jgi:hypothetical protein